MRRSQKWGGRAHRVEALGGLHDGHLGDVQHTLELGVAGWDQVGVDAPHAVREGMAAAVDVVQLGLGHAVVALNERDDTGVGQTWGVDTRA